MSRTSLLRTPGMRCDVLAARTRVLADVLTRGDDEKFGREPHYLPEDEVPLRLGGLRGVCDGPTSCY